MSINSNVYGDTSQWFNCYFQQAEITNKNKVAYFGENAKTLSAGVTNNKLSYEQPIDKSLSYCGLGTESAFSHVAFFGYKDNQRKLLEYNDRTVTNFAFFEKTTNTNYTTPIFINITELNRISWRDNIATEFNNVHDLSPLTVVNPHNIILFAEIEGKAELSHSWTTASLDYVMNNIGSLGWQYFRRVKITAYFGNVGDNVAFSASAGYSPIPSNYKPFQIGILDEYNCSEKSSRFYMYSGINSSNVVWGFPTSNDILNNSDIINIAYVPENAKPHLKISSNNEGYIEYYDGMFEDILKTIACFGLYFTGNATVAANGDLTNSKMYIGLIDEDGVGRGRYLQGADTVNAPQAASDFKDMHNIDYDPNRVDPNTYYNSTELPLLGGYTPTEYYVNPVSILHSSAVVSALNELAEIPEPSDQFNWEKLFMWQEPIECIIAWRIIYLKPSYNSSRFTNVKIGWFVTSETSSKMYVNNGEQRRIDLGEKTIFPHFGNCLDYDPYTKMSLYVPFCGSIEIPPSQFMGHKLHLYINVNDRTGEMEVLIMLDNKLWGSMKGSASIEYPLSGSRSMEYIQRKLQIENQITDAEFSGIVGMLGNAAGASISFVHGNPAGSLIQIGSGLVSAMESIDKVARLEYELDHTNNKIVNLQKDSPTVSLLSVTYPFILIQRPQLLPGYSEEIYSKTVGFATLENTYKSNVYGYTEAINPLLDGISCTITEKNLIVEALKNGCIFDEKRE